VSSARTYYGSESEQLAKAQSEERQRSGVRGDCDGYPVNLETIRQDLPYAKRAVVIHQGEDWPAGRFCRNCHARWPCRLYRWGFGALGAAGWTADMMRGLVARAEAGELQWR
jgi:hypothetical protein